jgi:transposase
VAVDGLGNPVTLVVTAGQEADITHAPALIEGRTAEVVIADKGYDSKGFVEEVEAQGAEACIPTQKSRKQQRTIDGHVYKERNVVERFLNRIKHYRRVATRYDKTARNFLAMVHVASIMVLLR